MFSKIFQKHVHFIFKMLLFIQSGNGRSGASSSWRTWQNCNRNVFSISIISWPLEKTIKTVYKVCSNRIIIWLKTMQNVFLFSFCGVIDLKNVPLELQALKLQHLFLRFLRIISKIENNMLVKHYTPNHGKILTRCSFNFKN